MLPELITEIPGRRSRALAEKLRRFESRNVTFLSHDWPIFWERAEGINVWDVDGNRFLDFTAAFGVGSLGHTAPGLRAALTRQAGILMHAMGDVHPTELKAELCARLSEITFERWGAGPGKVILGNSGFEAVEAALKTALLYTGRAGVVAFHGGYHGLGMGALTAVGLPYFRDPFRAQLADFAKFVRYPCDREEIENVLRQGGIGCVLVEPVQGRGGCIAPPADFLPMLREVCDSYGTLLALDEIYTGFNRTGALFACEHSAVVPDLICVGKSLTGGFPMSACIGRAAVMDGWPMSKGEALHTSTFLGSPLGCAMALASINVHAEVQTAANVRAQGAKLADALAGWGGIRGLGLMRGIELQARQAITAVKRALRDGVIVLADGPGSNVLSFCPPFCISDEEIEFLRRQLPRWLAT